MKKLYGTEVSFIRYTYVSEAEIDPNGKVSHKDVSSPNILVKESQKKRNEDLKNEDG